MRSHKKNLIVVFDLDQTIGYFTQFAIFMEGIESYIKRKLKRDEFYKLLDLYPKIFRPKMMDLFKYLEKMKRSNKWLKIMIYTNNNGPKSWTHDIKNYIEKKLNLELLGGPSGAAHVKDVNARDTITAHGMCIICTKIAMQT